MNITRKSILSMGSGIVLACGLIVILVLISAPFSSRFSLPVQKSVPYFIFVLSLLVIAPVIARRLNRLADIKRVLGWTFIGIGMEFIAFPVSFLFVVKSANSTGALMASAMIFIYSVLFGMPAGLICIAIGIFLIKSG
ncbi:MAG: hypothetical protein ABOK23_10025 [Candidatus Methanoperedens sp.]|nr:hypothetical protein [Candidatus Methanoperedens sp.]